MTQVAVSPPGAGARHHFSVAGSEGFLGLRQEGQGRVAQRGNYAQSAVEVVQHLKMENVYRCVLIEYQCCEQLLLTLHFLK